jgi:hypothetical protein
MHVIIDLQQYFVYLYTLQANYMQDKVKRAFTGWEEVPSGKKARKYSVFCTNCGKPVKVRLEKGRGPQKHYQECIAQKGGAAAGSSIDIRNEAQARDQGQEGNNVRQKTNTTYPSLRNDAEGVVSASENEPIVHFRPTNEGSSGKDILKMLISFGHRELLCDPFFQRLAKNHLYPCSEYEIVTTER